MPETELTEICRRYQVKELAVFGSAARGTMRPDSDIDLLVDFLPEARPGLLGVAALMRELTALLGRIRPGILAEAQLNLCGVTGNGSRICAMRWTRLPKGSLGGTEAD